LETTLEQTGGNWGYFMPPNRARLRSIYLKFMSGDPQGVSPVVEQGI